ncbi:MAG: hypothetical protein IPK68_04775 [Bdellovibrionales bacterium]|nr:hypothetical protein [Bdellovibrionales bacterium]
MENIVDTISKLAKELKFSETTARRMEETWRFVPTELLAAAVSFGKKVPDPQGAEGAMRYTIDMFKNGKKYELEVVYRAGDKTVLHFLYK